MSSPSTPSQKYPVLENGDRVTRDEFERRYHQMPNLKKAELIEGTVYVPSPLRYRQHGRPHSRIITWLETYAAATPGLETADNTTVRLDFDNEPQPDALLRLDESVGGKSRISEDDYLEGAPELIVEIAGSSVSYDLHDKRQVYRRHGVREYLIWLVQDQAFRWYVWEEGNYRQQQPDASGILKSPFFPGLWLDVSALLTGEMQQVLAVLNSGLNSPEHQALVKELYEADYNLWVLETVKQLQNREFDSLDWENLIDEVLDLSKREKRKIENLLIKLFEHLLILQYWESEKERNRGHWEREITSFRLQILRQLEDSPSLKNHLNEKFQQCYQDGCKLASKHSQLPRDTFAESAIAPLEKVLDENWFPLEVKSN